MSQHPNEERIRLAYEATAKGEADIVRGLLADDLVWHIPGRHRFSGDYTKAQIMARFQEIIPEFSETGEAVITTFNLEIEGIVASDEWVFTRVHWNHTRDAKRFDQHGVEVTRMNVDGQIAEFWAYMQDTGAFDEFFA